MGCGCKGNRWAAPSAAQVEGARNGASQPVQRTRELIPGGYWNGPAAKPKSKTSK